jgi:hypothetical protein
VAIQNRNSGPSSARKSGEAIRKRRGAAGARSFLLARRADDRLSRQLRPAESPGLILRNGAPQAARLEDLPSAHSLVDAPLAS